jgi:hypothetical protein
MKKPYIGRIGGTERNKPALKYANETGECTRDGCDQILRKAPAGYYGKYCNKCSRLLIDHGSFNTKVPKLTQQPYKVLYETIKEVGYEHIKERNYIYMAAQNATLERTERYMTEQNMGQIIYAEQSDLWLLNHYYHHALITKGMDKLDWLLHMTAIVGVVNMRPDGFDSDDQASLFLCKRGLGVKGLPSVRLDSKGEPKPHSRFPLKRARSLAKLLKEDWSIQGSLETIIHGSMIEEVSIRVAKKAEKLSKSLDL